MPICIDTKEKCTGCYSCFNSCPKGCITMVSDSCGFPYPKTDLTTCCHCDICKKVCPLITNYIELNDIQQIYAAWSNNESIRFTSTSGGMFFELAKNVIARNGYVCGAAYDENNVVRHIIINNISDLDLIKQSKYSQSQIDNVFSALKSILNEHTVLFCGTPCQVNGLKNFLGRKYENLYTIDFICRGVNSPKAYSSWLSELESIHSSKVSKVWFKYKEYGWKASPTCTRIEFQNGDAIIQKGSSNFFMFGYLGPNLYIRPSCGNCVFKGISRASDITLGDFWGIELQLDDDRGVSLVMINTPHGDALFHSSEKNITKIQRSISEVYSGNVCLNNSVNISPKSEEFLNFLNETNFTQLIKQYTRQSAYSKFLSTLKQCILSTKIIIKQLLRYR